LAVSGDVAVASGNVGIGIVPAPGSAFKLDVAGNTKTADLTATSVTTTSLTTNSVATATVTSTSVSAATVTATTIMANSVNGEKPPYVIQMGDVNDSSLWHSVQVPSDIIQSYLGDADGGTVRLFLRRNGDDLTHAISERMYMEQPIPGKPEGKVAGIRGSTLQQNGGGEQYFILNTATGYDLIANPYGWVYMRNYSTRGLPGLPGGSNTGTWTGADKYRVEFLTVPDVSATIVIYDR
jgi:hypothetical protein